MYEAGESQPKMIQPVVKRHPRDRHAKGTCTGKIRQAYAAGLLLLAENHIPFRPIEGTPGIDGPFQRAPDIGVQGTVAAAQFLKHADHPDIGRGVEDRQDLSVPRCARGPAIARCGSPWPRAAGQFVEGPAYRDQFFQHCEPMPELRFARGLDHHSR